MLRKLGGLPSFIVGGTGKSGTTTVDRVLRCHPEVGMSRVKEPCFFCWEDLDRDRNQFAVKSIGEYRALFGGLENRQAIGEVSPHYLGRPLAARRISEALPRCKLVFILRNPVDRAYSLYMHFRRDGAENNPAFLSALQTSRFSWNYTAEALYATALSRYLEYFPSHQIKILFYDDLVKDKSAFFSSLFAFIGVSDKAFGSAVERTNVSGLPQNPLLSAVLRMTGVPTVRGVARKYVPTIVRDVGLRYLHNWMAKDLKKQPFPNDARRWLNDYYEEDVLKLSQLTGRTLLHWLTID